MTLGARAIDGAFWNVGLALTNKVVTLAGQIALAWFLVPADMGLANLALAIVSFTVVLQLGGLGDVLLRRNKYLEEAGQALSLSLVFGFLMALAIIGLGFAWPGAQTAKLRGLLSVLAMGVIIGCPVTVYTAGLKNRLDFKGLALTQLTAGLFYTPAAVFLAWAGWGPYALIVPVVPQQMLLIAGMMYRGVRPSLEVPTWSLLRTIAKPSLSLSLTGFFIGLQSQVPVFICGFFLSSTDLGHFSWGWVVAGQTVYLLATNLREVLFPAFTRLSDDPKHMAVIALKAARAITAMLCLACGVQALLIRVAIEWLVPIKWLPAVPVVICASIGLVLQGLSISGMAWLNACGNYRILLKLSIFQVLVSMGCTWLGLEWGGLLGASLGCATGSAVGAFASVFPIGTSVLLHAGRTWWRPVAGSTVLWVLVFSLFHGHTIGEFSGAALFVVTSAWLWWREDDGGLAGIVDRIAGFFRVAPAPNKA